MQHLRIQIRIKVWPILSLKYDTLDPSQIERSPGFVLTQILASIHQQTKQSYIVSEFLMFQNTFNLAVSESRVHSVSLKNGTEREKKWKPDTLCKRKLKISPLKPPWPYEITLCLNHLPPSSEKPFLAPPLAQDMICVEY